jgi:predicted nucleic acid-binding protein
MKRAVIDASVLVKLFFEEDHSEAAERWVQTTSELLAPELIWAEAANVVWKRSRRGDLDREDASEIAAHMLRLPLQTRPSADLLPDAIELALRFDRTVYDSLYVVLAVKTKSVVISGDKRLVRALADTPLAKHIVWIGAE